MNDEVQSLIDAGLEVDADNVDDREPLDTASNRRATNAGLVRDLVEEIGVPAILEALANAASGAYDVHHDIDDLELAVREELLVVTRALETCRAVVS